MPILEYGEKFSTGSSQFTKLKSKGDKIRFRLLGAPFVEGKHFFQLEDGKWDIKSCPRINDHAECANCATWFEAIGKAKKTGDKKEIDAVKNDKALNPYRVAISFYFPVINRDTAEFEIFQSTKGVRDAIEEEVAMGTKVLEVDFIVLRTETPGKYYKISRVDSGETPPLTAEEKEAVTKFKTVDLASMVSGSKDEAGVSVEENSDIDASFP